MKTKMLKKVISIILATLFVLEILPLTVFASALERYNHARDFQLEATEKVESPIAFEVTEQREENLKIYQRKDGSYSAFASATPIHYRENGEWKDIDNTLVERKINGDTVLTNKNNSYQVEFPEELTSNSEIKLDNGESEISFSMRDISTSVGMVDKTMSNEDSSEIAQLINMNSIESSITFENIKPNIAVEYVVGAECLKESIILEQRPTAPVVFEYELNTNGESAVLNSDASISIYSDSEIAFVIESPYMFDSSDTFSENIAVSLTLLENEKYLVTYTPDYTWLSNEDIAYPVTIDPTTRLYRKRILNEEMYGTYTPVNGSDSTKEWFIQNHNANYSELCLDVVNKFFETNTVIISAKLSVYCVDAGDSSSNVNIIAAKEITGDWETDTSTPLPTSDNILDYNIVPVGESVKRYYWDITEAAAMWALGQSTCKGIALAPYSTDRCNVKVYKGENNYSTWMPWLEIDYKTVDSSRDGYAYSTVDMGRAGTVNFNQYTGTFYLERSDLSLSGNLMPVTTGAIYDPWFQNSSLTGSLGAYWNNTNFLCVTRDSQYTETVTNDDETTSTVTRTTLKIFEPDMTVKIYTSTDDTDSSGRVKFEDKTGETSYTVYAASDVYSTRDYSSVTVNDGSVTRYFDASGRISKFVDEHGNESVITFGTSTTHTISSITDGVGRKYKYNSINIGSMSKKGELEVLTSSDANITMGGENVALTYGYTETDVENTALLTSITYPDGEQVKYEYNSDFLMTAVENIDGSRLEIAYQNGRVLGYKKYVGEHILESGTDFYYESATQRVLEHYKTGSNYVKETEIIRYDENLEEISRITKKGDFSASNYNSDGELISDAYTKPDDATDLIVDGNCVLNTSWNCAPIGSGKRKLGEGIGRRVLAVNPPCYQLDSAYNSTARAYQSVSGLTAGDTYTFAAWAKATAVASKFFGIIVEDANKQVIATYNFDTTVSDWQFGAASFKATTDTVTIYLAYDNQLNYAYFDGITMFKSDTATVIDLESNEDFEEDSDEFIPEIEVIESFTVNGTTYKTLPCSECSCAQCTTPTIVEYNGEQVEGFYNCACGDETATCMCLGCRQERGKSETKDSHNNILTSSVSDGNSKMVDTYSYTDDGNYLYSVLDSANQAAVYNYNTNNGLLDSYVIDPGADGPVEYTYNAVGALTQVSQLVSGLSNGTRMTANYTYDNDRITSISHSGTTYNFEYDAFGNQTVVKVGNQPLVSYTYTNDKSDVNSITYGNGFIINYTLDKDGNITKIKYDGTDTYSYEYSDGVLTAVYDYMSMLKTVYADDGSATIYPFTVTDSVVTLGDALYSSTTDDDGNSVETVYGTSYTYSSAEEAYVVENDTVKTTESVSYGNNDKVEVSSSVDFFGRATDKTITYYQNGTPKAPLEITYGHKIVTGITSDYEIYQRSVNRIDSLSFTYGDDYDYQGYKYDTRGNITEIYNDDVIGWKYEYDEAGQLKEVHNVDSGESAAYSYDVNGNIISKTKYQNVSGTNLSTGTVISTDTYSYTDTSWSDKLTAFNGQSITYDSMGNPLSYRGATLTWNGRLLMSYEKDGIKYTYTYNDENLRTNKTKYVSNVAVSKETYIWSDDVLIATNKYDCATATTSVIKYLYDSNGEAYGFTYNGKTYLYIKNLQGDVTAIISAGDELLCLGLFYDPWGNVAYQTDEEADEYELQVAQEIAVINNITYRGYFYDSETGLYYLQSRYYDPEVGRFINADDTEVLLETIEIIIGPNLFAYCKNNSINCSDFTGEWVKEDHDVLNSFLSCGKSFKDLLIYYDRICDVNFASTNKISYPFHSRSEEMLIRSIIVLYNTALFMYQQRIKYNYKIGGLFSNSGFTCIAKSSKGKKLASTEEVNQANNSILRYINNARDYRIQAAILLGFCLHIIQDYYAHQIRARVKFTNEPNFSKHLPMTQIDRLVYEEYKKHTSACALEDNKNIFKWRFQEAKDASKELIKNFFNSKVLNRMWLSTNKSIEYTEQYKIGRWYQIKKKMQLQTYRQVLHFSWG